MDGYDDVATATEPDVFDADGPLLEDADPALAAAVAAGASGGAFFDEAPAEERIDPSVQRFLIGFHRAVREGNVAEIQQCYESTWNALTERLYRKAPWPSAQAVSALVPDEGASPDVPTRPAV